MVRGTGDATPMMNVLFIHENTLGHGSYLPVFADYFGAHPELGINVELLNATPLPDDLAAKADWTAPGLRRFGLDMHFGRWRKVASAHVRSLLDARGTKSFDAIVVNTQSVALELIEVDRPLFVCLDATFRQLTESKWFSDPPLGKVAAQLNAGLLSSEQKLYQRAATVLPWSQIAAASLREDYQIDPKQILILPPSIELPECREKRRRGLFIGADFKRKGGDLLLATFRRSFTGRLELDLVTESDVNPEPGVRLWRNIRSRTAEWEELWRQADLFLFPSQLETFGIVLVEALAFGVPIVSSRAGAAEEILDHGKAGALLDELSVDSLSICMDLVLSDRESALERARIGRARAEAEYNLGKNAARFADALKKAAS
jgi:hypothetical protein